MASGCVTIVLWLRAKSLCDETIDAATQKQVIADDKSM